MNLSDIYSCLCCWDDRNPLFKDISFSYDEEEINAMREKIKSGQKCYCDNCFYGRNELAVEILRLKELAGEKE